MAIDNAAGRLAWVWAGLILVMAGRAVSIWVPYHLKVAPFKALAPAAAGGSGASKLAADEM